MLDVDVNGVQQPESGSGVAFPVIWKEYWEKTLSQTQHEHERKQAAHQDVHGENQSTLEQVKVRVPQKPFEPTNEERQSHEGTRCPFRSRCEVCVKAKSPEGSANSSGIAVVRTERWERALGLLFTAS